MCICFIDLENLVQRMMRKKGIPEALVRSVMILYYKGKTAVTEL